MQQQKAAPLVFLPARALSAAQDLSSGFPSEAGGERSHPGQAMLAVKWKVCKAGATQAPHLIGKEKRAGHVRQQGNLSQGHASLDCCT